MARRCKGATNLKNQGGGEQSIGICGIVDCGERGPLVDSSFFLLVVNIEQLRHAVGRSAPCSTMVANHIGNNAQGPARDGDKDRRVAICQAGVRGGQACSHGWFFAHVHGTTDS